MAERSRPEDESSQAEETRKPEVKIERSASTRKGRTKQRESRKSKSKTKKKKDKEPFSHIASHIIPPVALATALPPSPRKLSLSRSPSPVVRAIALITKVGQAVATGEVLSRSSSRAGTRETQDTPRASAIAPEDDISDTDPGYEAVAALQWERDSPTSSRQVRSRAPLPLPPDDEITDDTRIQDGGDLPTYTKAIRKNTRKHSQTEQSLSDANITDDMRRREDDNLPTYAKVMKKSMPKITQPEKDNKVMNSDDIGGDCEDDDGDDITYVTQMEDPYSRSTVDTNWVKHSRKGSKKINPVEKLKYDIEMEDLSEGEVYDEAFDSAEGRSLPLPMDTQEVTKARRSSGNSTPKGSAHDETDAVGHLPPLPRSKSIQSIDSVGSAQSPRLRTPREIGRDAALKRLEELGFDEMAKEFGMSQSPKVTPRRDFFRQTDYEREQFSETPLGSYPGDLNINSPIIAKTKGQRTRPLSESAKWEKVVEEPLLSESIVKDEFASNEMILQGLDADAVTEEMLAAEHLDKNHIKLKPEDGIRNSTKKEAIKPLESSRIEDEATEGYQTVMVTEADRLKFDEQYQISSENNALLKRQQSLQDDLRMQQERILETIAALDLEKAGRIHSSSEQQQQLRLQEEELRKIQERILDEQLRFSEQQKVLQDQHQKILTHQESLQKHKEHSRPVSSFSMAANHARMHRPVSSISGKQSQPDHYLLLEGRLKAIEAERKALTELNASLQEENQTLRQLSAQYQLGGSEGLVYKEKYEEAQEENENLKDLVHRLNVELSRYQAKYRPPTKEEVDGLSLSVDGPVPPWLVNTKYLSPLILAFDDRIKEKCEIIKAYEAQLTSFKARVLEIVQENQELHLRAKGPAIPSTVTLDEWEHLQEQAKLVLEENQILMEQIDLKDRRLEEIQQEQQDQVSRLAKQLRLLVSEKRQLELGLSDEQVEKTKLQKDLEKLRAELTKKITLDEHERRLEDLKRNLTNEINKLKLDSGSVSTTLEAVNKEKQQLAVKLADAIATNSRQQTELDVSRKALKRAERKLVLMQSKIDAACDNEFVAKETLMQVVAVAERNAAERDKLAQKIRTQRDENDLIVREIKKGGIKIEHLENTLKDLKMRSKQKFALTSGKLQEQDKDMSTMRDNYEQEVVSLKELLREKQRLLENIQGDKQKLEEELELMWRSLSTENKRVMKSMNSSNHSLELGKFS